MTKAVEADVREGRWQSAIVRESRFSWRGSAGPGAAQQDRTHANHNATGNDDASEQIRHSLNLRNCQRLALDAVLIAYLTKR